MKKNLLLFCKYLLSTCCLFLISSATSFGQTPSDLRYILRHTDRYKLNQLSEKLEQINAINKEEVIRIAQEKGWVIRQVLENGTIIEITKIDDFGHPVYNITHNVNAASTISTNQVWPGGSSGLSLSGLGLTVGEWDGGAVLSTHNELLSRVNQVDGAIDLSDHSTHVAGTLIGGGANPSAIGMAFQAGLDAYDWTDDDLEMATAGSNGLLLSNHSYGQIRGWIYYPDYDFWGGIWPWIWLGNTSISETEDFKFGYYDEQAQIWDQVAHNAPLYLIVKSAGNDRGDGPSPGTRHRYLDGESLVFSNTARDIDGGLDGYDCVANASTAKNVLTVGAVEDIVGGYAQPSDVVMASFSGWGPCDDGRIKPDICGNGIGLLSSFSDANDSYGTYSGTSMASPNVTGSLLLLQEYYNALNPDKYMRSATLKALAIHTADEAGANAGPNYQFGWGLMNTAKATDVIQAKGVQSIMSEIVLNNNKTYTVSFYSDGTSAIKASICWTDPAGTPVTGQLNPSDLMLVNDLDLRIQKENTTFYPYVLDPTSPSSAATKADNFRDNVEQVFISSAGEGVYTAIIGHKGELADLLPQEFSLIITGTEVYPSPPTIVDFSPETGASGETVTIIGSGFLDVSSLSFGGKQARHFFVESDTKIIADVGSEGASGDVKVVTNYGSHSKSGFVFTPSLVEMSQVIVDGSANDPDLPISSTFVNWFPVNNAVEYEIYAHGKLVNVFISSHNFWAELSNLYFDVNDDLQFALKVRAKLSDGTYTSYGYPEEAVPVETEVQHEGNVQVYAQKGDLFFMKQELGKARITIYNTSGQSIITDSFTGLSYRKNYNLSKGIYLVKLVTDKSKVVEKVSVMP